MHDLVCRVCRARHRPSPRRFRCDCGAPVSLEFEPGVVDRDALPRRPLNLWRYREALPLGDDDSPVSLGEGFSPVVDDACLGAPAHFVLEYVSPTGSFKDRGAALIVSHAVAAGASAVIDDTSGNAGIALAAHAARAGLSVRLFVPDDAAEAKPRLAAALGAEVVRVSGGRAAAATEALRAAEGGAFYASHAWSPFFLHGVKTLAYSIAEGLRWTSPGAVLVPVGNGSLVLGLDLGFREMRRHGLIDRRPAILGVQASACAPLAVAFERGEASPVIVEEAATAADGVRVSAPPRGREVLEAVRASGGFLTAVDEEEIARARAALWSRGYPVESTAALPAALLLRDAEGLRRRFHDLVVVLTGSGLKEVS